MIFTLYRVQKSALSAGAVCGPRPSTPHPRHPEGGASEIHGREEEDDRGVLSGTGGARTVPTRALPFTAPHPWASPLRGLPEGPV